MSGAASGGPTPPPVSGPGSRRSDRSNPGSGLRARWRGLALAVRMGVRRLLGLPARIDTPDRRVLEDVILPALSADPAWRRVLFIGCDWYTAHYPSLMPNCSVTTLEPRPGKTRYGAARHWVGRLEALDGFAPEGAFDAIVCNGVYGWGLNRPADCEQAFTLCASRLRPGGLLVLGWNDVPGRDPAPLRDVRSLQRLDAVPFAGLTARCRVPGSDRGHTFDFYRRPEPAQR